MMLKQKSVTARKKPAHGLKVSLFPDISKIPVRDWNAVCKTNLFMSTEWIQAFNYVHPLIQSQGVLFYDSDIPVGAAWLHEIPVPELEMRATLESQLGARKAKTLSHFLAGWPFHCDDNAIRVLVGGNHYISGEHGLAVVDGYQRRVFAALGELINSLCSGKSKISFALLRDYEENVHGLAQFSDVLTGFDFVPVSTEPLMRLTLDADWYAMEDYSMSLQKKYRMRLNAVMKKTNAIETLNFSAKDIRKYNSRIHELYLNTFRRAEFKLLPLAEQYWSTMKDKFGEQFELTGYLLNEQLVAFRSSWRNGDALEAHFVGLDYEVNKVIPLYSKILYDFLQDGIIKGVQYIEYGRTAPEIKSTLGAVPVNLQTFVRHRSGISTRILQPFIRKRSADNAIIYRQPFKTTT
jgi:hypothetical protein